MAGSFAAASAADASTLYACVKKNATVHVYTEKKKCKKGEKSVSWNNTGPAGTNGANGTNGSPGAPGAPGQPQTLTRFKANIATGKSATLYSADGITYNLTCHFVLFFNLALIGANGSAGQSYGLGTFGRPTGQETKENDIKSEAIVETIGGAEEKTIALDTNAAENKAKNIQQNGVWSVTVEGPTTITWLHIWMETGEKCAVHGTALTVAG
jgi:hypothetical protein